MRKLTTNDKIKVLENAINILLESDEEFLCIAIKNALEKRYQKDKTFRSYSSLIEDYYPEIHDKIFDHDNIISPDVILARTVWKLIPKLRYTLSYEEQDKLLQKHKIAFLKREINILKQTNGINKRRKDKDS